ncbi:transglutaminase-like domain-containing protein [Actinokineospora sp. HUAS TT18]|uniref:transglutaminase-like domain-containing protein n=1 Tax=Actinokineospora sp. HUAS TT18 TaxID=3447451 RepID=UPI003F52104C
MSHVLDEDRRETEFLDFSDPTVQTFIEKALRKAGDPDDEIGRAIALYYAVRDGLHYEVYGAVADREAFQASAIIKRGMGFCVHKSIVYAAAVRALGIPSRIVYGDVRNHLSSPRLRELVGGDVFCFHSLTSVFLDGHWVKATPVFNKLLCHVYRIAPLDFDGRADSLYHPYDEEGRQHMEFLRMRGEFADFPYETVVSGIREAHPLLFQAEGSLATEAVR